MWMYMYLFFCKIMLCYVCYIVHDDDQKLLQNNLWHLIFCRISEKFSENKVPHFFLKNFFYG